MAFSDYSATPASNTLIAGKNIGENCPAANVNDVIRQLAADGRILSDAVAAIDLSGYMPKTGGAFSSPITLNGAGAFAYWAASGLLSAPMYVQASSAALPSSPAEGTIVFQY